AQLATPVPGTFGSIIDTLRHLVGADSSYLFVTGGRPAPDPEADDMDIKQLRAEMESHQAAWADVVAGEIDADAVLVRTRDDGSESHAPLSIRLAQALHHGSDHRSQVCTALTVLEVTPPDIDVWDFGFQDGRVFQRPAPT
ncbi:MAG TPA: DinB family protein, partial [Acidimicrobiia bacterium]|nr:DinB family protein [Acidimicrobiia bacterium]